MRVMMCTSTFGLQIFDAKYPKPVDEEVLVEVTGVGNCGSEPQDVVRSLVVVDCGCHVI